MEVSALERVARTPPSPKPKGDVNESLKQNQSEETANLQLQDLSPNAIQIKNEGSESSDEPPDGGFSAWLQGKILSPTHQTVD
jgi:hypothetical protein